MTGIFNELAANRRRLRREGQPFAVHAVTKSGRPYKNATTTHRTRVEAEANRGYLASVNPGSTFVVLPEVEVVGRRLPRKGDRVRFWESDLEGVRSQVVGSVQERRRDVTFVFVEGRGDCVTPTREMEILSKDTPGRSRA